jgi:hypothetical protein
MGKDTAYRTSNPEVVTQYIEWRDETLRIREERIALGESLGREVWINGSGYQTHIAGFGRVDMDKDGDLIPVPGRDGYPLIVSNKRGQYAGRVVPNLRRKAGKDFEQELARYITPQQELIGMPGMHIYGDGFNLRMGYAVVFLSESRALDNAPSLYALWATDDAPVDAEIWEQIPLSEYHLARERYEAVLKAEESSGE